MAGAQAFRAAPAPEAERSVQVVDRKPGAEDLGVRAVRQRDHAIAACPCFSLQKTHLTPDFTREKLWIVFRKQRGRPLKFGRPAQLLAVTLPHDVVDGLRRIHRDPAWAIVSLYEKLGDKAQRPRRESGSHVELAQLSPDSSLIVVDPQLIQSVPGVSVVPVAAGRAFLAFGEGRGLADLEVAVSDRLQKEKTSPAVRKQLAVFHRQIRDWRRSRRLRFSTRSIIIVERVDHGRRGRQSGARSS